MTIAFGWDKGLVSQPSAWRKFLWALDIRGNWVFVLPFLSLLFMVGLWRSRGRDPRVRESVTVMYEPPQYNNVPLTPGEVGALVDEKLDPRDITSTIVGLAVKGFITIEETKTEGLIFVSTDYYLKKFEPDELRARIKNLIEQRKRIHEHFQKKGIFELTQTKITSIDKKFLKKAFEIITQNLSDSSFSIEAFGEKLYVSKSLLRKKIVSLTGEPPVELIKRIRLKKAIELIEKNFGNLSEMALEVGFNNPAYFSECFKKQFGVSPSQYYSQNKNNK